MKFARMILILLPLYLGTTFGTCLAHESSDHKPRFKGPGVSKGIELAGVWDGTYASNKVDKTDVTLVFQQSGSTVTGTYLTGNGAQGTMSGIVDSSGRINLRADQITPTCLGEYAMTSVRITKEILTWRFVGWDCLGFQDGKGEGGKAERLQQ